MLTSFGLHSGPNTKARSRPIAAAVCPLGSLPPRESSQSVLWSRSNPFCICSEDSGASVHLCAFTSLAVNLRMCARNCAQLGTRQILLLVRYRACRQIAVGGGAFSYGYQVSQ